MKKETNNQLTYREFIIPKKSGKPRKICAPNKRLLKYQQNRLPKLYDTFQEIAEAYDVDEAFHGFLPNRNCVTAARCHVGYSATIMMDIGDFFDSVKQNSLISYPETQDKYFYHKQGYTAQGFATSPILANIALIPVIADLKYLIDGAITIYADDVAISVNKVDKDYLVGIIAIVEDTLLNYGFKVKKSKTRIRYASAGSRHMLGIAVGDTGITVPRKLKRKIRAARHQNNGSSLGGLVTWSRCLPPKALR